MNYCQWTHEIDIAGPAPIASVTVKYVTVSHRFQDRHRLTNCLNESITISKLRLGDIRGGGG